MKQTVIVNIILNDNDDKPMAKLNILVNGHGLGGGRIGGEPEDNSFQRDYNWIAPMMKKLAERLGAEAEINVTKKED